MHNNYLHPKAIHQALLIGTLALMNIERVMNILFRFIISETFVKRMINSNSNKKIKLKFTLELNKIV